MKPQATVPVRVQPAIVTLVTAPDCHFCTAGKAVIAGLSETYPLIVEEVAWSSPEGQDLVARHGLVFPPGLLLDGACVGFGRVSERKLRRLLERRATATKAEGD